MLARQNFGHYVNNVLAFNPKNFVVRTEAIGVDNIEFLLAALLGKVPEFVTFNGTTCKANTVEVAHSGKPN